MAAEGAREWPSGVLRVPAPPRWPVREGDDGEAARGGAPPPRGAVARDQPRAAEGDGALVPSDRRRGRRAPGQRSLAPRLRRLGTRTHEPRAFPWRPIAVRPPPTGAPGGPQPPSARPALAVGGGVPARSPT